MNELSIHTIAYLQLHVRHNGIPKVIIWGFGQIYDIYLQDILGKLPPSFEDHRKVKNPYLSRYGEKWVDKMKFYTAMSKLCCSINRIHFMMNEVEKLMKGSVHEDHFYIAHDDLVLMTAKKKINWMKQNGYLPRWLLHHLIPHAFNSLFLPSYALFKALMFLCHQLVLLLLILVKLEDAIFPYAFYSLSHFRIRVLA